MIGFLRPFGSVETLRKLAATGVIAFSVELMPRTTRAQSMDALSVFANIVGYRAVVEAAAHFGMFFPGQITAAGRVKPAHAS